ncbi:MAG: ABC transporter ATP-binding protein [Gammaproteobacteria bacterium]|nr:ABC transporter ATP-binding protein [Gammaproteobacteria bacterium]MBU1442465.1 ABC transporter ATP-binding protein [Gammaproteobacteria bacterium]MBU2288833.1 ABC transporter ATP-binding protein [Gammaproteobacteria bacterium]
MLDIQIDKVSKTWRTDDQREVVALDNVSFGVPSGGFCCIVGPSGSGKSTLFDVIAGLVPTDSGQVVVGGKAVDGPGAERGVVFQGQSLFPWRTVQGNVEFGLQAQGRPRAERREIAKSFIDLVGLAGFEDARPSTLSGGMYQRVAVARSLATSPDVLLMDEPFGALDAQSRESMQSELIRIWRAQGTTILFITHSVQEAVFLADRIVVMSARPGRVVANIDVALPRERDRTSAEFGQVMREVYTHLTSNAPSDIGIGGH